MKSLSTLLCAAFVCLGGFSAYPQEQAPAQKQTKPDKVYLKSGEIVTGFIETQTPGESVTYRTADGELRVIDISEIKRADRQRDKGYSKFGLHAGYKGYYSFAFYANEFTYIHRHHPQPPANHIEFSTTQGYQFTHWLYAGAGVAWQCYWAGYSLVDDTFSLFPIFGELKITPVNHRFTPIIGVRAGGFVGCMKGFLINPEIGCRVGFDEKVGLNITLGYSFQRINTQPLMPKQWAESMSPIRLQAPALDGLSVKISVDY